MDGLTVNDEEARALAGTRNLIAAGRRLLALGPRFVVVKKGEHGAFLFAQRPLVRAARPTRSRRSRDPTGAGDSFAGGLIGCLAGERRHVHRRRRARDGLRDGRGVVRRLDLQPRGTRARSRAPTSRRAPRSCAASSASDGRARAARRVARRRRVSVACVVAPRGPCTAGARFVAFPSRRRRARRSRARPRGSRASTARLRARADGGPPPDARVPRPDGARRRAARGRGARGGRAGRRRALEVRVAGLGAFPRAEIAARRLGRASWSRAGAAAPSTRRCRDAGERSSAAGRHVDRRASASTPHVTLGRGSRRPRSGAEKALDRAYLTSTYDARSPVGPPPDDLRARPTAEPATARCDAPARAARLRPVSETRSSRDRRAPSRDPEPRREAKVPHRLEKAGTPRSAAPRRASRRRREVRRRTETNGEGQHREGGLPTNAREGLVPTEGIRRKTAAEKVRRERRRTEKHGEGGRAQKTQALDYALGQIEKQFGKGTIMRLGQRGRVEIQGISTGSLSLDLALGGRGIPRGRITEIFGPESSGKTTLCLHVIANAQKAGGVCAFIDAEHAFDAVLREAARRQPRRPARLAARHAASRRSRSPRRSSAATRSTSS